LAAEPINRQARLHRNHGKHVEMVHREHARFGEVVYVKQTSSALPDSEGGAHGRLDTGIDHAVARDKPRIGVSVRNKYGQTRLHHLPDDGSRYGELRRGPPARLKVPTLVVLQGKTDQREYLLTDKLTVIGKSAMATIKLKGWFAPKAAAQINRGDDNSYYIGAADRIPKVNGESIERQKKLSPGDVIDIAGVKLEFQYRN